MNPCINLRDERFQAPICLPRHPNGHAARGVARELLFCKEQSLNWGLCSSRLRTWAFQNVVSIEIVACIRNIEKARVAFFKYSAPFEMRFQKEFQFLQESSSFHPTNGNDLVTWAFVISFLKRFGLWSPNSEFFAILKASDVKKSQSFPRSGKNMR